MIAGTGQAGVSSMGPKERIFQAAMCVALRNGFGKVTLNQVAREAGFSKGGLLHHFATKNDLIRAMLEHYAAARPLQAGEAHSATSELDSFAVAILIAAAENPSLLEAVRTQLGSDDRDSTDRSGSMPGHLQLIGDLVAKFGPASALERKAANAAFVVRHRADGTLLGLFVAQGSDALWDMVDEFCNPAEYEYRPVPNGALTLSSHETDVGIPGRPGHSESGGEMSGGLMDVVMAKGDWTPFHVSDEGSGVLARTLDYLEELEHTPFATKS